VFRATVAGNTVLLQGDGLKDRNALFYSYGTAWDDFIRKDQREAREPEPDQTEPDQQEGERGSRWQGCFQLRKGLLFLVLPGCGMFLYWPENEDPKNESWKRTEAERGSLKWTPLPVMWAGWTNFHSYLLSCTKKWNVYQTPHPLYPFVHNPALVIVFCISVPCFLHLW